jgi:glucan biosynthesis protein C
MYKRLHSLDYLRAILMSGGIILHGVQMYMTMHLGFDYYSDPAKSPVMDAILIYINTFRMPAFFFLSGFFSAMLYQKYGLRGLLKNRIRRILVPFVIFLPPLALVLDLQWIVASQLMETGTIGLDTRYLPYPRLLWDNTHHLWFLYYLMIVLAGFALPLLAWERCGEALKKGVGQVVSAMPLAGSWFLMLLGLVFATMALQTYTGRLNGGIVWTPYWPGVFFFAICVLYGWAIWFRQECLEVFSQGCWRNLGIAHLFLGVGVWAFFSQGPAGSENFHLLHPLLTVCNGVAVAFFIAALTGLFVRYYSDYSPRARYFSDSSYWIFLVHQPLLLLFAIPLFWWDVPAGVKFVLVASATLVTSLVSYAYLVRRTWLGKLL